MLDVDFLLGNKGLKPVVVYEYVSGYLRGSVLGSVRSKVECNGGLYREVDYSNFRSSLGEGSLWGEMWTVVDIVELFRVNPKDCVLLLGELVRDILARGVKGLGCGYVFLCGGVSGGLGEFVGGEDWKGLKRVSLVLDEVKVGKGTVGKLVEYFMGLPNSVLPFSGVSNVPELVGAFEGFVGGAEYALSDFALELDLVLGVAVEGGKFDLSLFRGLHPIGGGKEDYFRFHRIIYRMCLQRDCGGFDSFLREISLQLNRQNKEPRVVLSGVYRVLREVIGSNKAFSSVEDMQRVGWGSYKANQLLEGVGEGNVELLQGLLKFQTLLSQFEPELNGVNPLVSYKQLGNLFLN